MRFTWEIDWCGIVHNCDSLLGDGKHNVLTSPEGGALVDQDFSCRVEHLEVFKIDVGSVEYFNLVKHKEFDLKLIRQLLSMQRIIYPFNPFFLQILILLILLTNL